MNTQIGLVQYGLLKSTYAKSEAIVGNRSAVTAQEPSTKEIGEDRVTLNTPVDSNTVTYGRQISAPERVNSKFNMLGELAAYVFKEQGVTNGIDSNNEKAADTSSMKPKETIESREEDGYWGLGQTSERIYKLALGFAGFDAGKLDNVKEGILTGFEKAKNALGGELPEISQRTVDMALKKLNDWGKDPVKPLPL